MRFSLKVLSPQGFVTTQVHEPASDSLVVAQGIAILSVRRMSRLELPTITPNWPLTFFQAWLLTSQIDVD